MIKAHGAFSVFVVENLHQAKLFYQDNFGFQAVFENEWYIHLVSELGIQIAFMLPNQTSQPKHFHDKFNSKGVIFSLEVDNVDANYDFAKENSLEIILTLRSEAWGQRHFAVLDPNGVYIDVVQAIAS